MGLLTSGRGRMEMPCLGRAPWAPFQALLLSLTKVSGIPGPPPRHFCSAHRGERGPWAPFQALLLSLTRVSGVCSAAGSPLSHLTPHIGPVAGGAF